MHRRRAFPQTFQIHLVSDHGIVATGCGEGAFSPLPRRKTATPRHSQARRYAGRRRRTGPVGQAPRSTKSSQMPHCSITVNADRVSRGAAPGITRHDNTLKTNRCSGFAIRSKPRLRPKPEAKASAATSQIRHWAVPAKSCLLVSTTLLNLLIWLTNKDCRSAASLVQLKPANHRRSEKVQPLVPLQLNKKAAIGRRNRLWW